MNEMPVRKSPVANHCSLRALLREGLAQLEAARVPSAALAVELLLVHTLGRDRAWIYAHPEEEVESSARERYFSLVTQRASGTPTQYLTGHQEFWGLDFEVTPDVLIPRPETEHVIEVALERLGVESTGVSTRRGQEFHIADVGTGSGCIAVALAHELPAAKIVATDISAAALVVARRNAARHGVASQIDFLESNLLDSALHERRAASRISSRSAGVTQSGPRSFDLIASNPPYVSRREFPTLPREVREHEPSSALFGGENGTEIYAPLIAQAATLLNPGGILVLELGHDSADTVSALLSGPQWSEITFTKDLAGISRVASARVTLV